MNDNEILELTGIGADEFEQRAAEWEEGRISEMKFGAPAVGRPRIYEESMDTITVKVPHSRIAAMNRIAQEQGITRSEFVRRAIDNEILAMA